MRSEEEKFKAHEDKIREGAKHLTPFKIVDTFESLSLGQVQLLQHISELKRQIKVNKEDILNISEIILEISKRITRLEKIVRRTQV